MKKIILFSFIIIASVAMVSCTADSLPENNIPVVATGGTGGQSGTINPPPPPGP